MQIEKTFNHHDLFFSITNKQGFILYGNDVFIELSEYSALELSGKPHKIIRHPDMPKAVFKVFWDNLKIEKPVVAYVKNQTHYGKFYWVLALAFPYKNYYISIRLKPSSKYLDTFKTIYQSQIEFEKSNFDINSCTHNLREQIQRSFNLPFEKVMYKALARELILCFKRMKEAEHNQTKGISSKFHNPKDLVEYMHAKSEDLLETLHNTHITSRIIKQKIKNAAPHQSSTVSDSLQENPLLFKEQFDNFYSDIDTILSYFSMIIFGNQILNHPHDPELVKDFELKHNDAMNILKATIHQYNYDFIQLLQNFIIKIEFDCRKIADSIIDFIKQYFGINLIYMSGKINTDRIEGNAELMEITSSIHDANFKIEKVNEIIQQFKELIQDIKETNSSKPF